MKRFIWNREFAEGRWDCLESSPGDFVYACVERHANNGSILDLGCGSGSTGNELEATKYQHYVGIDVSDTAIAKATMRTIQNGRTATNTYLRSDIFSYVPDGQYDVILFRDSIYYVPYDQIPEMLNRYSQYLKRTGTFVVRMYDTSGKYEAIIDAIENNFTILEKQVSSESKAVVVAFRQ